MFCSKCGKKAEGDFCWNCGAKLYKPEDESPSEEVKNIPAESTAAKPEICKKPVSFMKFKATRKYTNIQFDDVHQIIAVGSDKDIDNLEDFVTYLRYSEVLGAEVKCTYEGVSKTSTGSMIGRAAVGSLISPGAAMVGGATAKRIEKQKIDSLSVHITTSNARYPLVRINYLGGLFYDEAELVCGILQQVKLAPPTEEAFELTEKWGAGNTPLKADLSPRPQPKAAEPAAEPWRCSLCDYKNPAASSRCMNCSAPKSRAFKSNYLTKNNYLSEVAEELPANNAVWFCPDCDYKNNGGKSCRNCGASRPEQEEKGKKSKKLFGKIL